MASLTGTDSKSIFKIVTVVSILGPLVSGVGITWALYTFGASVLPNASYGTSHIMSRAWPSIVAPRPAHDPWVPYYFLGVLLAGGLSYLHARFIWFPLEPVGLLLATDGHALIEGLWTMIVAAWVLKMLTIRIGGSKLYENKGIPIVSGFITGYLVTSFLGGILFMVRYFVPF